HVVEAGTLGLYRLPAGGNAHEVTGVGGAPAPVRAHDLARDGELLDLEVEVGERGLEGGSHLLPSIEAMEVGHAGHVGFEVVGEIGRGGVDVDPVADRPQEGAYHRFAVCHAHSSLAPV